MRTRTLALSLILLVHTVAVFGASAEDVYTGTWSLNAAQSSTHDECSRQQGSVSFGACYP